MSLIIRLIKTSIYQVLNNSKNKFTHLLNELDLSSMMIHQVRTMFLEYRTLIDIDFI